MKRIAAPMVGGMISSTVLTLLIIPSVYSLYRGRGLRKDPDEKPKAKARKRQVLRWSSLAVLLLLLATGLFYLFFGQSLRPGTDGAMDAGQSLQVVERAGYKIEVFSETPDLKVGENALRIVVLNAASGEPVEAESVSYGLKMDMPGMQMQADAQISPDPNRPGHYVGSIRPTMGGEWIARVSAVVDGQRIEEATTVNVKQ